MPGNKTEQTQPTTEHLHTVFRLLSCNPVKLTWAPVKNLVTESSSKLADVSGPAGEKFVCITKENWKLRCEVQCMNNENISGE
jgi:hypothetical protein